MRKEYELTDEELNDILNASKPTPVIFLPGGQPMFGTPQENANNAWMLLGRKHNFDYRTVKPVSGKSQKFFTAEEE